MIDTILQHIDKFLQNTLEFSAETGKGLYWITV